MSDKIQYVCGFLFDGPKKCVALIQKNRPDWQKGLLNGLGGKVKEGESSVAAMQREFLEEAGVDVKGWHVFNHLMTDFAHVDFLVAHRNANLRTMTDETVSWYNINGIWQRDLPVVANLNFLIPMALYALPRFALGRDFMSTTVQDIS